MNISDLAKQFAEQNNLSEEINQAYIDEVGVEYATAEAVEEAYAGSYDSKIDFVQELLYDTEPSLKTLPSYISIDWETTTRDVMMDYFESNGHYFRNL